MQRSQSVKDLRLGMHGLKLVGERMRARAQSASNCLGGPPLNEIRTDVNGVVTSVTPAFCDFTGYAVSEIVGRKCNFLQGAGTDQNDVTELRHAMMSMQQTSVVILNYCKDGSPFWNILTITPNFRGGVRANGLDSYLSLIHI